jgi:histidine ammonia-lyase
MMSISAIIAAQAIDLRGNDRLSKGLTTAHGRIRELIPELLPGDSPPSSYEHLVKGLEDGILCGVLI